MKTALLLHGMPGEAEYYDMKTPCGSNCHWFPWIQKQLIVNDYHVWAPDIYHSYSPEYLIWKQEIERYTFNSDSLMVGHSCGAGFLLRWLSENKLSPSKVVLVAPWIDPLHRISSDFFDFKFDFQLPERTRLTIYFSDNDHDEVNQSVEIINAKYPNITYRNFEGYGHFCSSDIGSNEFPELLEDLLS